MSSPGIEPRPPTLQAGSLPAEPQGKPQQNWVESKKSFHLSLLINSFCPPPHYPYPPTKVGHLLQPMNYTDSPSSPKPTTDILGLDKCVMTCSHHYKITQSSFIPLKSPLCSTSLNHHPSTSTSPFPQPHPSLNPAAGDFSSVYFLHSFAFSRMSHSWNHMVYRSFKR